MALAFEQQPKESDKAFAAFSLYLSMGPQRSTAEVASKLAKSEQLIRRWSARWCWLDRVAAYATHMAAVERESTEALTRAKAPLWLKRQEEHKEVEWAMRGELVEAGRKILESFRDGSKGATLGDVARALELASKLGRLASGMETDRTEITGEDGGPIKVELEVALKKIYGAEVPPAQSVAVPRGEIIEAKVIEEAKS
ncbi:hypothetical protein GC207_13640 [bacterium]|nr:hypothetical protein [bacterium]